MTTSTILITGNTYPVKDAIKDLGGRWDAANKGWRVSPERADEARRLVAGAPMPAKMFRDQNTGRSFRRSAPRGRWTGCSCGSIEDHPRASDCASCQYDY